MPPLLEVRDLHTEFRTGAGVVPAVDGISYTVERGETVAIVGESGSGKTAGALSILRLIPDPPGRITEGQILFAGRDLRRCIGHTASVWCVAFSPDGGRLVFIADDDAEIVGDDD